jgi:hypothetical protein
MAFYSAPDPATDSGSTVATMLLGTYALTPRIAPLIRLGFVSNAPPAGEAGQSLVNPLVGATYLLPLDPTLRLAFFLGVTVPVGMGGGNDPDVALAAATGSGILARSAMDNAMFAVNDFTVLPGVDLAFVRSGFTAQVEATLFQLTRVRGEEAQADDTKTNFTTGLHLGYFPIPLLSLGADLRYQRWLSTPRAVADQPERRDTLTFAVGPRVHVELSESTWIRPGLSYARGLDAPMTDLEYQVVQLDVPVQF